MPPFLMFLGGKTYSNIVNESNMFLKELKKYQPEAKLITVPGKRHAGMIFQFMNSGAPAYKEILDFMNHPSD